jgi:hypothetical protein
MMLVSPCSDSDGRVCLQITAFENPWTVRQWMIGGNLAALDRDA